VETAVVSTMSSTVDPTRDPASIDRDAVANQVIDAFHRHFGGAPLYLAQAPGRVNLIGDHTDYTEGFVLPMAIDRAVWIALRPRSDQRVVVHSLDFGEQATIDLSNLGIPASADSPARAATWHEYLRGMAWVLTDWATSEADRPLSGWEGVMAGNVPRGAGLSSSAAVELAVARACIAAAERPWDAVTMARLAQRAENRWVGVQCGIMDQLVSAAGVAGCEQLIDCRSLNVQQIALPENVAIVVLDTMTRRGLVDSKYNERRASCDAAAAQCGVRTLRDVSATALTALADVLDPLTYRRARHVVTENVRVLAAAHAFEQHDVRLAGALMNASHASLRDDFSVSREELDVMVGLAQAHPACAGARMTGAGFGGCAVALVNRAGLTSFVPDITRAYAAATGYDPSAYICAGSNGASVRRL